MKHIFLILVIGIASLKATAQEGPANQPDSLSLIADTPDTNEAGGINAAEADEVKAGEPGNNWLFPLIGGLLIGAVVAIVLTRIASPKKTSTAPEPAEVPAVAEKETGTKLTATEVKKLKQEIKNLTAQVASLQAGNDALEKNMSIYRNFDSSYFGEAFRKLIVPMNEALERGSKKEIMEHLLKIMAHFSSLTRYKIAKKQPYDETNIHYLLNQKGTGDAAATEINSDTPIDKIPKNIKTIADMLQEQGSKGLDDSIISGYKIKNL